MIGNQKKRDTCGLRLFRKYPVEGAGLMWELENKANLTSVKNEQKFYFH